MSTTDSVQVTIEVAVDAATAFDVFTRDVDRWWKRGPRYRFVAPYAGTLVFEPGVGGRLLHVPQEGGMSFEVGRIRVWEPPTRLALTWRLPNFTAGQLTEVDVRFEAVDGGTRVVLTHSGWDSLPADHPARHGLATPQFILMRGGWWGELLGAAKVLAERSAMQPPASS